MNTIRLTKKECDFIRSLTDFDLKMLISEVSDFGWDRAKPMFETMKQCKKDGFIGEAPAKVLLGEN